MISHTLLKLLLTPAALVCAAATFAQVAMDLSLNRTVYMQYEPIYAAVTLRNDSGRALAFGHDPKLQGFVLFEIRDSKNNLVPKRPGAEINTTGLLLRAGEIKRLVIPVSKYYNLDPLGTYRMFAYVSHAQLPAEYQSKETRFQVSPGVEVWSKSVVIPDLTGKGEEKSVERTYSIRSMTEGPDRFFYLVVEDNDKVYGVIRIGKRIGQEQFRAEVDMLSRIHLLMPVSPKVFHYLAFALDGTCIANQHWKTTGTIPTLVRDPANGMVTLAGGAVARVGIDFQDPNAGKLTATQLLNENGDPLENTAPLPQPPRSSGLLDLGKEVVNPNR